MTTGLSLAIAAVSVADGSQLAQLGELRMRRASPREALEVWQALVIGRWAVVAHGDRDGRRCLVVRRIAAVPSRGLEALSPREREVVARAALGHANKLIAYELGIAITTVASALGAAARKLGVTTRAELLRRFQSGVKGAS